MLYLHYYISLFILSLWSTANAHSPSPFDIRLDHYKIDTTYDLVINTPRPRFSWKIRVLDNRLHKNIQQTAYQIQLQSTNLSQRDHQFQWDSKRVVSSQSTHVPYTGHSDLLPSTYFRFRLRVWATGSEKPSEWTNWIQFRTPIFNLHEYMTKNADLLWIGSTKINMNELRKEFMVPNSSPIESAIVYISGLGYYEFYLNGNKVDPSRKLDPGWTTYEKRTLLASYDVTTNITVGMNAVGVKLGNGWYSQEQHGKPSYVPSVVSNFDRTEIALTAPSSRLNSFVNLGPPRLVFTLFIMFENGNQMQVLSDQTWRGREGSIKHDSVYNGEIYDSRSDRVDWSQAGFNDSLSAWIMPESLSSPINASVNGSIVLQDMPPIRAGPDALHFEVTVGSLHQGYLTSEDIGEIKGASLTNSGLLKPIDEWTSDSGVHTFDLGQNMAGLCRFKFHGLSGFGTYIRHAEILIQPVVSTNHATRNINTENLRDATTTDTYVLHGALFDEVYEPTFTVHGFRYLSIFGPPNKLTVNDVECLPVHSETTLKGHFTSSNPIINQVQHNVQWAQLSNLMSVPTDCPQRDERRGWMGDAAISIDEALYNFDLIKFYLNFLNLIVDIQLDDGEVPDIVPGGGYPADPNWGTALPTITWQLYRHYGDSKILEDYYDHVRAYVEYLRSTYNKTGLANFFWRYGDWLPPPPQPPTNGSLVSSYVFLHDVHILLNMSQVLEKKNDTDIYSALYQELTEEFHRAFFSNISNFYADGMQAAQALALALPGVVPANVRDAVIDHLVNDINQKGIHVTTGIVSIAQLYPILSDNGHHDLALELISSTTYPSYGFMFTNPYENATTLWEVWNTPFTGPAGSRNHIMYGSIGAWFYSHLAGIDLSSTMITIRPRMASEAKKHLMAKLDCQLSILHGLVHVSYTRDERDTTANSILLRVSIPPNTRARVMFEPLFVGAECATLNEDNKMIWSSDIVTENYQGIVVEKDPVTSVMTVHIGSGDYEFQALWK